MTDEELMRLALEEARHAPAHGDVPIGCVVAREGAPLGIAHNERERRGDPTAHAEMLAMRAASESLGSWRLEGASVYVTLEPCPMCAGALVAARVARLVYGPFDERGGAAYSLYNLCQDPRLNHQLEITTGVLGAECAALLRSFFDDKRAVSP